MSRLRSRRGSIAILSLAALSFAGIAAIGAGPAAAATVDPTIPDGDPGSLRDVLNNASNGDVIDLQAGATYILDQTNSDSGLTWGSNITINGNGATVRQTIDEIVMNPSGNTTINDLTITGGRDVNSRPGGGIHLDADILTLNRVNLVDNQTCGTGGGINNDDSGVITIVDSTISDNQAADGGGALYDADGGDSFVIVNSTITNNTAGEVGGINTANEGMAVDLVYSDVVNNTTGVQPDDIDCSVVPPPVVPGATAGDDTTQPPADPNGPYEVHATQATAANVATELGEGVLTTFGSVIALPNGGPNCSDNNGDALTDAVSQGYNFSDDASCDLTGTGDRQSAGDPGLGALADNGGPTPTLLPAATSPLVNFIPLAACGGGDGLAGFAVTSDQRGVARPQDTGCEIGSVEVEAVVVRFTG